MGAVTPDMREQRRRRREAERAARGEIRRRRPTPHPAGLRAQGWNRPATTTPAPGTRLLGAATASVAITDRATVTTASRASSPVALPPTPVTRGPLPAAASLPRPTRFGGLPPEFPSPRPVAGPAVAAEAVTPGAADTAGASAPAGVEAADAEAAPAGGGAAPAGLEAAPASGEAAPAGTAAPAASTTPVQSTTPPPATGPAPAPNAASTRPGGQRDRPVVPPPPSGPLPSDLFAHALGLSPANTPAPPPEAAPGRHSRVGRRPRDPWAGTEPGRRRRVLLAAAVAVVVLAGVGTAVGAAVAGRDDGTGTSTTAGATDGVVADAATWLSGNVGGQQRIVTPDASLARDLNARGVPVDAVDSGATPPTGAILVATAAAGATPDAVTPAAGNESVVLLAVFTGSAGNVTVSEVVGRPAGEVRDDLAGAVTTAASAAEGLRNNAAVRIDADAEPVFTAGRLDLRAATVLATIAQDQQVEVVSAPQDRAESRAGRPVRTIVVSVQDAQAVREIAATARSPYAPDVEAARADDAAPAGSLRLTWPAGAAITMPFQ